MKLKYSLICLCSAFILSSVSLMAYELEYGSAPSDDKYVVISDTYIENGNGNKVKIDDILNKKKKSVAEEVYQSLAKKDGQGVIISGDLEGSTSNGGYYWGGNVDTSSKTDGGFFARDGVKDKSVTYDIFIPIGREKIVYDDGSYDYNPVNQAYLSSTVNFVERFQEAVAEGVLAGSIKSGYNIFEPYADSQLYIDEIMDENQDFHTFTNTSNVKYTLAYFYSPLFGKMPKGEVPLLTKEWIEKGFITKTLDESLKPNRSTKQVEVQIDEGYMDFLQGNAPECESIKETDKDKMISAKGVEAYEMAQAKFKPLSAVNYLLRVAVPNTINMISPDKYGLDDTNFSLVNDIKLSIAKNYVYVKTGEGTSENENPNNNNNNEAVDVKSEVTSSEIKLYQGDFDGGAWDTIVGDLGSANSSQATDWIIVNRSDVTTNSWATIYPKYNEMVDKKKNPNNYKPTGGSTDGFVKDGSFNDYSINRGKLALYSIKQANGEPTGVLIPLRYMEAIYDTGDNSSLYATGRMLEFVENYTKNLRFAQPSTGMFNIVTTTGGNQGGTIKYYSFPMDSSSFMDASQHKDIGDKPTSFKIHVTFSSDESKGKGFMLVRNNLFVQDSSLIQWLDSDEANKLSYVQAGHLLMRIRGMFEVGADEPITFDNWLRMKEIKENLGDRNKNGLVSFINIISIVFGVCLAIYSWLLPLAYYIDVFNHFLDEFSLLQLMTSGRMYPVATKEEREYLLQSASSDVKYVYIHQVLLMTLIGCAIGLLFIFGSPIIHFLTRIWLYLQYTIGGM